MPLPSHRLLLVLCALLACGLTACADATPPGDPAGDEDPDLDRADVLFDGTPDNATLPVEGKADDNHPVRFDLVSMQSPVRNQASRGVCSIFSTVGLMEHLYIKEGTITQPDFSEQFLQWSSKFENGSFTSTGGSNARENLATIRTYGITAESFWPYEGFKWTTTHDQECDGEDDQPTRCYTNGAPPETALSAPRWHLPAGRWINSSARSIKGHMFTTQTAVVIGVSFMYQAWNHGRSPLPTNAENKRLGYVLTPNAADVEDSTERGAGHSILLVGWDDELSVQRRDEAGEPMVDEEGEPVMDTGFFLFKNSWGTGKFGVENPHGDGYGWISYQHLADHGRGAYVSGVPNVDVAAEVCGDGRDNDRNGRTDCDDDACASDIVCTAPTREHSATPALAIPDDEPSGVSSSIEVAQGGPIVALSVAVDIEHSYRGDLVVELVKGDRTVTLSDRQGAGEDDLVQTFVVPDFAGEEAAGEWKLRVSDHARSDTGTLRAWRLVLTTCESGDCGGSPTTEYENDSLFVIPDGDAAGATSEIVVDAGGAITALAVTVHATHPARGDLTVTLSREGGGEAVLLEADASDEADLSQTFTVADFVGQDAAGTWRLKVVDVAAGDQGTLDGWTLAVTR